MLRSLVRFERGKYLSSNKLTFLSLIFIACLGIAYSMGPQRILTSFAVCALLIFLLMIAVGVIYDNVNGEMVEQALLVKFERKYIYYLARIMTFIIFSMVFAVLGIIVPVLVHCFNGFTFFTRNFQISDILSGFVLFTLSGLCGGVIGLFFNKRFFKQRFMAIVAACLVGIACLVKGELIALAPVMVIFKWLMPPLYELNASYGQGEYFLIGQSLVYFIWFIMYIVILSFVYIAIMIKKGIK